MLYLEARSGVLLSVRYACHAQEHRRSYRECFYTAPIGKSCSGVILFKEALTQSATDGKSFVEWLNGQGVLPGVKVDEASLCCTFCKTHHATSETRHKSVQLKCV